MKLTNRKKNIQNSNKFSGNHSRILICRADDNWDRSYILRFIHFKWMVYHEASGEWEMREERRACRLNNKLFNKQHTPYNPIDVCSWRQFQSHCAKSFCCKAIWVERARAHAYALVRRYALNLCWKLKIVYLAMVEDIHAMVDCWSTIFWQSFWFLSRVNWQFLFYALV